MAKGTEKSFSEAVKERRATPSFDGRPIPTADLKKIIEAGLASPSGFNLQPWRFVVVESEEQRRRLRSTCFNQAKVEEASVVIVACGDAEGWRNGDLEEMLHVGRKNGMPEAYAVQAAANIPEYLTNHPELPVWICRQVMIALTTMMWAAEVMGYRTAPLEGFEAERVTEVLNLPPSYQVVAMLAIGHLFGPEKFNGGRFALSRLVFAETYGRSMEFDS